MTSSHQTRYVKQFVCEVLDFSSQYGSENARSFSYSITNIIGEPKIFPKYGDFTQAAVMRTYGDWWRCKKQRRYQSDDYIDVRFERAVFPWSIAIYETFNPGGLVRILALSEPASDDDLSDQFPLPGGRWITLWESDDVTTTTRMMTSSRMFAPVLKEAKFQSRILRLEFQHSHLEYYTEIDAVELTGTLQYFHSSSVDPPNQLMTSSFLTCEVESSDDVITEYFSWLPWELTNKIFSFLPLPDLFKCAKVSRFFRDHSYDVIHLSHLDLHPYWHLADNFLLEALIARLPIDDVTTNDVKWLNASWLGGCDVISAHHFSRFFERCRLSGVLHLDVTSSPCFDDAGLQATTRVMTSLRYLNVQSCDKLTSLGMRMIGQLRHLRYLNVYRTKIDDAGVNYVISNNPDLEELNLGSCLCITDFDRVFEELGVKSSRLKSLDVWRARSLTSFGLRYLVTGCHHLQQLDLGWCAGLSSNTGCFINLVTSSPRLRKLFLTANRTLCDNDVISIADHCPKLELLDILGTRLVTRATVEYLLSRCTKLRFLDLSFCYSFSDDVIDALRARFPDVSIKRSFQ